jgi:hypothetical protein
MSAQHGSWDQGLKPGLRVLEDEHCVRRHSKIDIFKVAVWISALAICAGFWTLVVLVIL